MRNDETMKRIDRFVGGAVRIRVKSYIKSHDTNRNVLAMKANILPSTLTHMMNTERLPHLRTVVLLSLATGMSLDELCGMRELREQMKRGR